MTLLTRDFSAALVGARPPCLSLYQPTHRHHPANQQDPIRFRNLVKELAQSLQHKYAAAEIAKLLEPFDALADDMEFWNHTLDGLVVFAAAGLFKVFKTQRPVIELVVAADSFHTKPLWRLLQTTDSYQVLGLNQHTIRLFEGNRDAIDEIDLVPSIPHTITAALGDELTEPRKTVSSYGGAGPGSTPMHHGHGGKSDEVDIDAERFFRVVDRAILEHYSRPSGLTLILAALPEHHALFHQISQNPFLAADGIRINPDALSLDELRVRAWEVAEPQYHARLTVLVEAYAQACSKGLGSDDLSEIAIAAVAGRVGSLLIDGSRQIPGQLNLTTGGVELGSLSNPSVDDLLDDLGELILTKGGQVWIAPTERMPTQTGLAAIYRY